MRQEHKNLEGGWQEKLGPPGCPVLAYRCSPNSQGCSSVLPRRPVRTPIGGPRAFSSLCPPPAMSFFIPFSSATSLGSLPHPDGTAR